MLGTHAGKLDEERARYAAQFLLKADAEKDEKLVAEWIEVGRQRAMSGGRGCAGSGPRLLES